MERTKERSSFRKKFIGDRKFYMMVLAVAVPIMIQNGITNFVSLLDNIMIGRIGTEQMSGASIVNQLIFVYNLCIFGGLKVVQLTGVTIPKEVRNLVSVDILKKYTCIPFELDPYNANILHLAMADPMDMAAIDDISIVTNLQIEPYIATTRDILAAIDRC